VKWSIYPVLKQQFRLHSALSKLSIFPLRVQFRKNYSYSLHNKELLKHMTLRRIQAGYRQISGVNGEGFASLFCT